MIGAWSIVRLCAAIATTWPVPVDRACPAATAIVHHHGAHDPLLVAAIVYGESRAIVGVRNGRVRGLMQTRGACGVGAAAEVRCGVRRLDEARAWCRRRGTPTELCLLAAYGSGPRGPRLGLYRRPRLVLARRARLRALYSATLNTRGAS